MFRPSALAALTIVVALTGVAESTPQTTQRHGDGSGRSIIGTIANYDTKTRTLTVSAHAGRRAFVLAPDTAVRQGSRVIEPRDLAGLGGAKVKVRYNGSGRKVTVESVMVSGDT